MKASELLTKIREDLSTIPGYIAEIEMARSNRSGTMDSPQHLLDYTYATYKEIKNRDSVEPDFDLDATAVQNFENDLAHYLDTYAPGKENLKTYTSAISTYLTFISKKPLHPPDMPFSDEFHIVKNGESYYCDGKKKFKNDPRALCSYCICKSESDQNTTDPTY